MEAQLQTIDIKRFKSLFPTHLNAELGDDCFVADFTIDPKDQIIEFPCRVDGYVALFCLEGSLTIDINLKSFQVSSGTLVNIIPGNIFRISHHSDDVIRLFVVAASKDFFSSINVDFKQVFNESIILLSNPIVVLNDTEINILSKYMSLATDIMTTNLGNKRSVIGTLISSVTHLFSAIWSKQQDKSSDEGIKKENPTRANMIFEQFLRLVTEFHTKERNVSFYADKLFLTPKYLSKLVNSVSGQSAPDWINSYVILEAKNMLKYSDLTISEIVYKLNFTNQSVFYKFFKCHTGLTPSEYRRK